MADRRDILVVDDEPELRSMLAEYLGRHGLSVRTASGGAELTECLARGLPDLLILDVNLPGEDGFAIARRVRAASDVPILMLTAAGDVVDRVVGLELGADDYILKPFDLRELRARINAVLRRSPRAAPAPAAASPGNSLRLGALTLDLDARQLLSSEGVALGLTAMEFDLLEVFARNPNRVLSRDRLLDLAHRNAGDVFDRSIDVRVTRLRQKIEPDPARPRVIKTIRGVGYMFTPDGA